MTGIPLEKPRPLADLTLSSGPGQRTTPYRTGCSCPIITTLAAAVRATHHARGVFQLDGQ